MTDIFNLNIDDVYQYHLNDTNLKLYFSTKLGGVSKDNYESLNLALHVGDVASDVIKNRQIYAKKIAINLDKFIYANQTHSTNMRQVFETDCKAGVLSCDDAIDDCDCMYSFDNVALNCFYADCTPIYFYAKKHNLIGVMHCGWQSTVKELAYLSITNLTQKHQIDPADLTVVIGPTMQVTNFEIKQDIIDLINPLDLDVIVKDNDKTYLDNVKLNIKQLQRAGVTNITASSIDTYSDLNLFSYRKNNLTGRMCATIYQTN